MKGFLGGVSVGAVLAALSGGALSLYVGPPHLAEPQVPLSQAPVGPLAGQSIQDSPTSLSPMAPVSKPSLPTAVGTLPDKPVGGTSQNIPPLASTTAEKPSVVLDIPNEIGPANVVPEKGPDAPVLDMGQDQDTELHVQQPAMAPPARVDMDVMIPVRPPVAPNVGDVPSDVSDNVTMFRMEDSPAGFAAITPLGAELIYVPDHVDPPSQPAVTLPQADRSSGQQPDLLPVPEVIAPDHLRVVGYDLGAVKTNLPNRIDPAVVQAGFGGGEPVLPIIDLAPQAETSLPDAPQTSVRDLDLDDETLPNGTKLVVIRPEQAETAKRGTRKVGFGAPVGSLLERRKSNAAQRALFEESAKVGKASTGTGSPLEQFAATYDDPGALPQLSVVLIDDGTGPLGANTFRNFPFPLSFAIPPSHPNVAETVRAYRAQGFEVLALMDLPERAQPSDVEVNLMATLDRIPEVVGFLESPGAGMQSHRKIVDAVTGALAESRHGLVLQGKGLNTAEAQAGKAGVAASTVFRDFDAVGEDADQIRRVLNQATFRAKQRGSVILQGRLRADTLSALVLWGLQDRSSDVAVVPVSAILQAQISDK